VAFTAQILIKTDRKAINSVHTFYTKYHPSGTIIVENIGKISFIQLCNIWLPLLRFSQNSRELGGDITHQVESIAVTICRKYGYKLTYVPKYNMTVTVPMCEKLALA